jgi:uncharacterized membrane protein YdbT with pleckstrin-like domain
VRTPLRPGEELVAMVRRHWVVLSGPFAAALFLLGCLIGAWFIGRPWIAPAAGAALAVAAVWAGWRWLEWRCDLWAITSERVIDEAGVLSLRAVDSPLDKIHNVACSQSLLGRVLGYGTLNIQTAAESGSTTIESVARPMEVKEAILERQQRGRYRAGDEARGAAAGARAVEDRNSQAPEAAGAGHETRECPFCAERIKARAKVCRFCGRDV